MRLLLRPPQSSTNYSTTEFLPQHILSDVCCSKGVFLLWSLWDALGSDSGLCPQARLEVHRFGISGYGKGKERVLEQERAIMLGAKVRGCHCLPSVDRIQEEEIPGQGRTGVTERSLQNKKLLSLGFFSPLDFSLPKTVM